MFILPAAQDRKKNVNVKKIEFGIVLDFCRIVDFLRIGFTSDDSLLTHLGGIKSGQKFTHHKTMAGRGKLLLF